MTLQQKTPDRQRAKNLLDNALIFLDSLNIRRNSSEASFVLKEEYDIIHLVASAIVAADGEKVNAQDHHKALLLQVTEKYKEHIPAPQANVWNELRKIRNDINYYGQKDKVTLQDFYERNNKTILSLRENLFEIIHAKIK